MPRQQNKLHLQYLLYRIHYALGDKSKAGEYLLREWQFFPHRLDILPEVLALNLLDQQQAEALLRSIQADYTENMDKHMVLAYLFWQKGDIANAWQHIERELELFPENQRALDCKWNLLIAQQKWPEALSWSERLPKKNQINHHYNLYRIYRGLQDHQLAANHLCQELQLHPHRVELIAELLTLENLEPAAVFALIRPMMKSSKPPPVVVQQLVKYFQDRGECSLALASLDWQLQFDQNDPQLIEQKRQLVHTSGQPAGER
jgi:tetratricopeptide (TPR) repeat protein